MITIYPATFESVYDPFSFKDWVFILRGHKKVFDVFFHEYIGQSARNFEERFKEHLKSPSPIHDHINISGHSVTIDNFSILGREDQNLTRLIKEALYIRVNNPSLNKNVGKCHLPHILDEVLLNISELKLK